MPRAFNGSTDKVTCAAGAVTSIATAKTVAVICRRTTESASDVPYDAHNSSNASLFGFYGAPTSSSFKLAVDIISVGTAIATTLAWRSADDWVLIAFSKATGTSVYRFHKYVYSTNTWTHENGNSLGVGTGTIATHRFAEYGGGAPRLTGDIACAGYFTRELADVELETLPFSLTSWYAAAPGALWLFDQQAVGTPVADLTGGGANQSAITGTTVSTASVPLFSYGLPILYAPRPAAAAPSDTYPAGRIPAFRHWVRR